MPSCAHLAPTPIVLKSLAVALLVSPIPLEAQAPLEAPRVEELATGVYLLHNPRANESWPQSNSLVVIGSRAVLVVDANYLPGTARADIAIIRRLTDRPVRYLVNTHWHYDHTNGNGAYRAAYPGIAILAHPETARLLRENAPRYLASVLAPDSPVRKSVERSRAMLDSMAHGGDTTDRALYLRRLAQRELELTEMASVTPELPDQLVPTERRIDLGGRTVILRHFGRGNTPGDLVAWLPRERILASGDLVVSPMPYAYNASPGSWIGVLDSLLALQPQILVPGHGEAERPGPATATGDPTRSLGYTRDLRSMLQEIVDQVRAAYRAGLTVEEARAAIDFSPYRTRLAGDDPFLQQVFDSSIRTALVDRAWAEAQGAT